MVDRVESFLVVNKQESDLVFSLLFGYFLNDVLDKINKMAYVVPLSAVHDFRLFVCNLRVQRAPLLSISRRILDACCIRLRVWYFAALCDRDFGHKQKFWLYPV